MAARQHRYYQTVLRHGCASMARASTIPSHKRTKAIPSSICLMTFWGNSSRSGCPFLDWRCSNARLQKLVYAHRMGTTERQFSPIAETWQQKEFDRIGTLEWKTTDGISTFRPFCALRADKTYQKIQSFDACSETELRNWLSNILCDSTARAADARALCLGAQKAITLATCSSEQSGQRDRTLLVFVETQPTNGESSP